MAPEPDLATIRRLLGDVPVRPLDAGLDHRVYAVGDALVARFGEGAAAEAELLTALADRLPLPVPVPVAVAADCLIQPRIEGRSLLHVPRAERCAFAPQLRAFADALHGLDAAAPEDDTAPAEWLAEAQSTWPAVRDEVPADRRDAIERFLAGPAPAPPARRTLIHADLGAEHVLVADGRITGVIDWGDAAIGDPAIDHGRLLRDFGSGGGERARFYAICTAIEDLAYGLESGKDVYRANAVEALGELP